MTYLHDTIRIAIEDETKQTRHHRNKAFFIHKPSLNKQVLRGLSFCPPCFDCGVYGKLIMNLRMIKTINLIIFYNISLPYLRLPCEPFTSPSLTTQAVEQGFPTWGTCTPRGTFAYPKWYL